MSKDTIYRQDAIDAINTWDKFGVDERGRLVRWHEGLELYVHLRDVLTAIVNLQSAQKTGRWNCSDDMFETAVCSCCGWDSGEPFRYARENFNYCSKCGADMRGGRFLTK